MYAIPPPLYMRSRSWPQWQAANATERRLALTIDGKTAPIAALSIGTNSDIDRVLVQVAGAEDLVLAKGAPLVGPFPSPIAFADARTVLTVATSRVVSCEVFAYGATPNDLPRHRAARLETALNPAVAGGGVETAIQWIPFFGRAEAFLYLTNTSAQALSYRVMGIKAYSTTQFDSFAVFTPPAVLAAGAFTVITIGRPSQESYDFLVLVGSFPAGAGNLGRLSWEVRDQP